MVPVPASPPEMTLNADLKISSRYKMSLSVRVVTEPDPSKVRVDSSKVLVMESPLAMAEGAKLAPMTVARIAEKEVETMESFMVDDGNGSCIVFVLVKICLSFPFFCLFLVLKKKL